MNLKLAICIPLLIGSGPAFAAPHAPVFDREVATVPTAVPYTEAEYAKELVKAKGRASRTTAAQTDPNYEEQMSEKLKTLRHSILALKSTSELDSMLTQLQTSLDATDKADGTKYNRTSPYIGDDKDYRFYAAQIAPLQCMKGIVWRFRPIALKSGIIDSKMISLVYSIAHSINILAPVSSDLKDADAQKAATATGESNIASIVFDYLTMPYEDAVLFADGKDLQAHLMNSCYPALSQAADRIDRLSFESKPVVWDNRVRFGVGTFPDDAPDHYKLIGENERHLALAMKYAGMHFISLFRSYSVQGFFELQTKLGMDHVTDSFFEVMHVGHMPEGVTSQVRATTIRRDGGQTFLLYSDGKDQLEKSWKALQLAIQELNLVWKGVDGKASNPSLLLNPGFFQGISRTEEPSMQSWMDIAKTGQTTFHSRVTGKTVVVNLHNFYLGTVPDLKAFLPTKFESSLQKTIPNKFRTWIVTDAKTQKKIEVERTKQYSEYRNWYYGAPNAWEVSAWHSIFPEVAGATDIPEMLRTVSEARGGKEIVGPLMQFVR